MVCESFPSGPHYVTPTCVANASWVSAAAVQLATSGRSRGQRPLAVQSHWVDVWKKPLIMFSVHWKPSTQEILEYWKHDSTYSL